MFILFVFLHPVFFIVNSLGMDAPISSPIDNSELKITDTTLFFLVSSEDSIFIVPNAQRFLEKFEFLKRSLNSAMNKHIKKIYITDISDLDIKKLKFSPITLTYETNDGSATGVFFNQSIRNEDCQCLIDLSRGCSLNGIPQDQMERINSLTDYLCTNDEVNKKKTQINKLYYYTINQDGYSGTGVFLKLWTKLGFLNAITYNGVCPLNKCGHGLFFGRSESKHYKNCYLKFSLFDHMISDHKAKWIKLDDYSGYFEFKLTTLKEMKDKKVID